MEKISGIYCIENIINEKKYIGRAFNIYKRWNRHQNILRRNKHENNYLQRSYNKYGKENFKYYIIQELPLDKELLKLMEIYWIAYYNTFHTDGEGYNLSRGGEAGFGHKMSEEGKRKISEAKKGNTDWVGRKHSDETKQKMSESQKGNQNAKNRLMSEESKNKISIANKGKKQTKETKEKNSKSHMGLMSRLGISSKIDSITSKYVGVHKQENKFIANITVNKIRMYLGIYDKEEDAAIAYDKKVIELLGDQAITNFSIEFVKNKKIKRNTMQKNKYKGVHKRGKRWVAAVYFDKKTIHIGTFNTEIEAARACDLEILKLYGTCAKINFPNWPNLE